MGDSFNFWIFLFLFVILPFLQWVGKKITEAKQASPEDRKEKRRSARELLREAKQEASGAPRPEYDPRFEDHDPDLVEDWDDLPATDDRQVLARAEEDARRSPPVRRTVTSGPGDVEMDTQGPMREIRDFLSELKKVNDPAVSQTRVPVNVPPPPPRPTGEARRPVRKPVEMDAISTHAYDISTEAYGKRLRKGLSPSLQRRSRSDIRRYLIWKEILSPPIALREDRD